MYAKVGRRNAAKIVRFISVDFKKKTRVIRQHARNSSGSLFVRKLQFALTPTHPIRVISVQNYISFFSKKCRLSTAAYVRSVERLTVESGDSPRKLRVAISTKPNTVQVTQVDE